MSDGTPTPAPTPVPPLGVVAQRIADVSPSWAGASVTVDSAPDSADLGIGRDRTIGVESIREGWLLHRSAARLASTASPDLSLLIGDWCYAAGLCDIADHGTLDDIATLANLVADVSTRVEEPVDSLVGAWDAALTTMRRDQP